MTQICFFQVKIFQQMNKELKSVSIWFKANKLSINIDKTKWTIF